ncbi:MAG: galactokinase [Oscillospiraceae bacterium]|nr:galactokinase [Oscillospiraceae bacterium]
MKSRYRNFSAPGRVEICGNHTDHQRGRVLAAAVGIDITANAKTNNSNTVSLKNDLFGIKDISLLSADIRTEKQGTPGALVQGVAAWLIRKGYSIGGFDATVSSKIPVGAGLSSSAAFAVLMGNIFKGLYGLNLSPMEIAQAGQFAENVYFGKPSGLMDQAASSFGGLNIFDFEDPLNPIVTPIHANLSGYSMCVVDTGGSHADLTADYTACTLEMNAVAASFGKEFLREVDENAFFDSIGSLRHLGDRAILRAIHFFDENTRVLKQAAALENGDIQTFLELVIASGISSLAYLQNVYSPSSPQEQGLTLALSMSEKILCGKGAWRVHGGGFAGTILAFIPDDLKVFYHQQMSRVFGSDYIYFLDVKPEGGRELS